jgi:hypothetical protein
MTRLLAPLALLAGVALGYSDALAMDLPSQQQLAHTWRSYSTELWQCLAALGTCLAGWAALRQR